MSFRIDRRSLLLGSAAVLAAAAAPPWWRAAAASAVKLTVGRRTLEVKGRAAPAFGIMQPDGTSGLTLDPGARFQVDLVNDAGVETMIHWHGQRPPYLQDGFPDKERPLIKAGQTQSYDFAPVGGTHWMHSHHGLEAQRQMNAPLIVRTAEDRSADFQEIVIFLDDFSFKPPEEILAGLTGGKAGGMAGMAGMESKSGMAVMAGMEKKSGMEGMAGMAKKSGMAGMDMKKGAPMKMEAASAEKAADKGMPGDSGMMMPAADLNDVDFDAFLANDRTLDDPFVAKVERAGRVRLRIINGAASTQYWIDLGSLTGTVIAADGIAVAPVSGRLFPMAIAQRLDILVDIPPGGAFPVYAHVEGKKERTGIVLAAPGATIGKLAGLADAVAPAVDLSLEEKLSATNPYAERTADNVLLLALTGSMSSYVWSLNDRVWPNVTPLQVKQGQRVVIDMQNKTAMAHPIHLHGHSFQVIELNGNGLKGAVRDTVLVPPLGSVKVAFDADNPGRWPLHCHNLYHQAAGMMTEMVYV
jgi:FtsP/CotA-like multicopper oxidase with cupredoxin domain